MRPPFRGLALKANATPPPPRTRRLMKS